jgi:DNA-binding transcriptional LysR family regulator
MNRVSVYELECFVAVAEELNFSRAARRLHMSQPPLSRQISSLEAKLELRLLERNTRAVNLTPAGSLYLEDARQILTKLDSAATSARRAVTGQPARLRLAFVGALLDERLISLLRSFRKLHPRCQIHLTDLAPAEQLRALEAGQVDGAFIGACPERLPKGVTTIIWKREPLLLALPSAHPLVKEKSVALSRLQQESWVMVSRTAAPAFRQQFDRLCRDARIRARVVQESERAAAVLTMVATEQGISLLPESMTHLIQSGVEFRPIKSIKPILEHAFAYRQANCAAAILDLLKGMTGKIGSGGER